MRLIDADVLKEDLTRFYDGEVTARQLIDAQPTVQPAPPEPCEDAVSRQVAIDDVCKMMYECFGADDEELDAIEVTLRELPAVQPDHTADIGKKVEGDCISRQAAVDAVSEYATIWMSYTDDMSASEIAEEALSAARDTMIRIMREQPAVQPEIIRCKDCDWWTKQEDSVQGRCELMRMYPAGGWYCGNARRRPK